MHLFPPLPNWDSNCMLHCPKAMNSRLLPWTSLVMLVARHFWAINFSGLAYIKSQDIIIIVVFSTGLLQWILDTMYLYLMLFQYLFYFIQWQKSEIFQESLYFLILGPHKILIKFVRRCFLWRQPHGISHTLPELFARYGGEEREGDRMNDGTLSPLDEITASCNVSPLVPTS